MEKEIGTEALEKTGIPGWWRNMGRSVYVHQSGAIVQRVNGSACRDCLKKYIVRSPSLGVEPRIVRAGASLAGELLDRFVCGQATRILESSPTALAKVAPPAKLCPTCGSLATLISPCQCGNQITDRDGLALVSVSRVRMEGDLVRCILSMKGYPPALLEAKKEQISPLDLITVRESGENNTIVIRLPGELVKTAILRSVDHE